MAMVYTRADDHNQYHYASDLNISLVKNLKRYRGLVIDIDTKTHLASHNQTTHAQYYELPQTRKYLTRMEATQIWK